MFGLLVATSCSAAAATCEPFEKARDAAYHTYTGLVLDELSAARKSDPSVSVNTVIDGMVRKYEQATRAGDLVALRKLIAIGLLTATAAKREPLDVTFKLVCQLAKHPEAPKNVLDPLACATIAVDGARRENVENRATALAMIESANKNLPADQNPAGAKFLIETISPIVTACATSR